MHNIYNAFNADWTHDLQIFSLTLSQLSYKGLKNLHFKQYLISQNYLIKPYKTLTQHSKMHNIYNAFNADWTHDLQIFSLTLSQLSYKGFKNLHFKQYLISQNYLIKPYKLLRNIQKCIIYIMPSMRIERMTFRSSVWRSPNWAIKALRIYTLNNT